MKTLLTALVVFVFTMVPLSSRAGDSLFPDAPGKSAPGGATIGKPLKLKYTGIHGKEVSIEDFKGKVVLIDFWATWCGPCVAEVPNVVAAYEKYHDKGFAIMGISLDSDKEALLKFTKEHKMTWAQCFDGEGFDGKFPKRFGVGTIPCMWLVDKEGNLVSFHGRENLQKKIEALLER
jgi:thiol-disulfide isomerase/thioredoxin